MLANITSASYNATTGQINVLMPNTTINGYHNTVLQYQTANTLSVPIAGMLVDLDVQAPTQMQITGYNNAIVDTNYTITSGEFTSYSTNWYASTRISGVEIQQAHTANKENMMMGQSSNQVISDILALLINICGYLTTHTHKAGLYVAPSGGGPVTGTSGTPVQTTPDDSDVVSDKTYIDGNKNLAITGTYTPI